MTTTDFHLPYVSLAAGQIVVVVRDNPKRHKTRHFPSTRDGCRKAGHFIRQESEARQFLCSSSLDFPDEDGCPDLDYRDYIMEAVSELRTAIVAGGRLWCPQKECRAKPDALVHPWDDVARTWKGVEVDDGMLIVSCEELVTDVCTETRWECRRCQKECRVPEGLEIDYT